MKDYDSLSCGVGQLGSLGTDCMASRVPPDSVVPHMGLTHRLPTSSCSQVQIIWTWGENVSGLLRCLIFSYSASVGDFLLPCSGRPR